MPVMVGQFLLLMVFLDKTWFGPVGKLLDERDGGLRSKLALVKDNSSDVGKLVGEAEKLLGAARAAAQKQVGAGPGWPGCARITGACFGSVVRPS